MGCEKRHSQAQLIGLTPRIPLDTMTTLTGPYTHPDEEYEYICRVFQYKEKFYNGITEEVVLSEGDILRMFTSGVWGDGVWYALYRAKTL